MDRRDYYFDRLKGRRYAVTEKKKRPQKSHQRSRSHHCTSADRWKSEWIERRRKKKKQFHSSLPGFNDSWPVCVKLYTRKHSAQLSLRWTDSFFFAPSQQNATAVADVHTEKRNRKIFLAAAQLLFKLNNLLKDSFSEASRYGASRRRWTLDRLSHATGAIAAWLVKKLLCVW